MCLLACGVVGLGIVAVTGVYGGWLKVYNDAFSLVGYSSIAILLYSLHIGLINRFFVMVCGFSYDWYLVHILVFGIMFSIFGNGVMGGTIALATSFILAKAYHKLLQLIKVYKG